MKPPSARQPPGQAGFTLAELLVYLLLSGLVMASVYQLLMGQSRAYGRQREQMDVHETLLEERSRPTEPADDGHSLSAVRTGRL